MERARGLGAIDLSIKLKIALCRNVSQAMNRGADWIGELKTWKKKRGRDRQNMTFYKFMYGDFICKYEHLKLDWVYLSSKSIYKKRTEYEYGGMVEY